VGVFSVKTGRTCSYHPASTGSSKIFAFYKAGGRSISKENTVLLGVALCWTVLPSSVSVE